MFLILLHARAIYYHTFVFSRLKLPSDVCRIFPPSLSFFSLEFYIFPNSSFATESFFFYQSQCLKLPLRISSIISFLSSLLCELSYLIQFVCKVYISYTLTRMYYVTKISLYDFYFYLPVQLLLTIND